MFHDLVGALDHPEGRFPQASARNEASPWH
jgi:hypothetical protein